MYFFGSGWVALVLALVGFFFLGRWAAASARAARSFKRLIVPLLLAEINPSLKYSPEGMSQGEFDDYRLFESYDRYSSQDLVSGTAGRTPLHFALVHIEEKRGWGRNRKYETVFEGLLFVAQFNKDISARTRVIFGDASFLDELRDTHVELEDPRFNRLFYVRSTDQVEARYILTPDMMDRFVALADGFARIDCVFVDDRVIMALGTGYGFFDPNTDRQFDSAQVLSVLEKLRIPVGIVEALDLNTRIWTVK